MGKRKNSVRGSCVSSVYSKCCLVGKVYQHVIKIIRIRISRNQ